MKAKNILILSGLLPLNIVLPISIISATTNSEINNNPSENVKKLQEQWRQTLKNVDLKEYPIDIAAFEKAINSIPNVSEEELDKISNVIQNDLGLARKIAWYKSRALYNITDPYLPEINKKIDSFYNAINQSLSQFNNAPVANLDNEINNFVQNDFNPKANEFRQYMQNAMGTLNSENLPWLNNNIFQNINSWLAVPPMSAQQFVDTYNNLSLMNNQSQEFSVFQPRISIMLTNNSMYPGLDSSSQAAELNNAIQTLSNSFPSGSEQYNAQKIASIEENIATAITNTIDAAKKFLTFAVNLQVQNNIYSANIANEFIEKWITHANSLTDILNVYTPYNKLLAIYQGIQYIKNIAQFLDVIKEQDLIEYCQDSYKALQEQYNQYKDVDPNANNALELITQYQNNLEQSLQNVTSDILTNAFPQNPSNPNAINWTYQNSMNSIPNFELANAQKWSQQVNQQIKANKLLFQTYDDLKKKLLITTINTTPENLSTQELEENKNLKLNFKLSSINKQTEFLYARNDVQNFISGIQNNATTSFSSSVMNQLNSNLIMAINGLNGIKVFQQIQKSIKNLDGLLIDSSIEELTQRLNNLQDYDQAQIFIEEIYNLSSAITKFNNFINTGIYQTIKKISNYDYKTMFDVAGYENYSQYQKSLSESYSYSWAKKSISEFAPEYNAIYDPSIRKIKVANANKILDFINRVTTAYNNNTDLRGLWTGLNDLVELAINELKRYGNETIMVKINNLNDDIMKYSDTMSLKTAPYYYAFLDSFNTITKDYYEALFSQQKYPNLSNELLKQMIKEITVGDNFLGNIMNYTNNLQYKTKYLIDLMDKAQKDPLASKASEEELNGIIKNISKNILNGSNQLQINVNTGDLDRLYNKLETWILQNMQSLAINKIKTFNYLTKNQMDYFEKTIRSVDYYDRSDIETYLGQATNLYVALNNAFGSMNNYKSMQSINAFEGANNKTISTIEAAYNQVETLTKQDKNLSGLSAKINQAAYNLNNLLKNYKNTTNKQPDIIINKIDYGPSIWYWLPTLIIATITAICGLFGAARKHRKNK
ncbi:hypothetical protein [Mycoplasma sp. 2634B]|uniref:hypothetical protein n=1 Tax=Mycoplasma sp. 2634B TaxID=3401692 RepID=UPI003AADBE2B